METRGKTALGSRGSAAGGTDTSSGNLISVLVGKEEDLKREQGATNKEPSENRKSAWKLKIELLK